MNECGELEAKLLDVTAERDALKAQLDAVPVDAMRVYMRSARSPIQKDNPTFSSWMNAAIEIQEWLVKVQP